jgi:excisionase family DNA binding protein
MKANRPNQEPMRTLAELCEWLNVRPGTVYKWSSNRNSALPVYRIGKHLRFNFSEVQKWLEKYHSSAGVKEFSTKM